MHLPSTATASRELLRTAYTRLGEFQKRRPKHLLSGLIVCGSCGSRMIVRTRKGGIIYFGCSARMNRLGCTNARNIAAPEIENRVLASLRKHLLAPDVIATAIDAYRSERRRLSQQRDKSRNSMERDLGELMRKIKRIVHAIADGQRRSSIA